MNDVSPKLQVNFLRVVWCVFFLLSLVSPGSLVTVAYLLSFLVALRFPLGSVAVPPPPSSSFNVCVHSEMILWMWKGPLGGGAAVPLLPSEQSFSGWQGKSKRHSIIKEVKSVSEVKCCQVKWWSLLLLWVVLFPAQSPLWRCCFPMFLILRGAGFAVTDYFNV